MKTISLAVIALTVLCGCGKSPADNLLDRARMEMLKETSNQVVGIQRVINIECDPWQKNSAGGIGGNSVTVDYLNKIGGIERTNIIFAFIMTDKGDGDADFVCIADGRAMLHRDHPEWYSSKK